MERDERVCPFCGNVPGPGMFCAACGRNLAAVDRLPTRAEWDVEHASQAVAGTDNRPLGERCAEATASFLAAMREPSVEIAPSRTSIGVGWKTRRWMSSQSMSVLAGVK